MNMPEEESPRTVSFVYEKAEGKRTIPLTGAFGGSAPDGNSVVAHAYVEHTSVPSIVTHEVGEGGTINLKEGDPIARGDATREVQATLVMSPEAARDLGRWLLQKADQAMKVRDNREGRDKS